jgi:hypothetical protein
MALIAPLLVLIFMGMVECGSVLYSRHTVLMAAREGARQLAVEGATEEEAIDAAQDILGAGNISVDDEQIEAENAWAGDGNEDRVVSVSITVPIDEATILGDVLNLFPAGSMIQVQARMRKEGELLTEPTD